MTTLAADLDTIFVALDRLRTLGWECHYDDVNLANRGLIALANVRERVAVQVVFPIEGVGTDGKV